MRRSRPGNFRAYEIAMRSWSEATAADAAGNREKCNHALALADEALQKDPACVLALVAKAFAHFQHAFYGTGELEKSLELAREAATAATRIDHLDHRAHAYMAMGHLAAGDFDGALAEARYAHDLNPNDVLALRTLGWVEAASGETAAASEHLHQALRLNPRDPFRFEIHTVLGIACFMDEDYAKGVEWGLLSVSENPSYPGTLITLAQNLVGMGDIKRAQGHIATLKSVAPDWLTKRLAGASGYKRPRDRERQVRFLRIATGLESTE
jgi:tetratricopeptide (TPR) repeat protein